MAYDKLSIINSALLAAALNPVETEDDGSPEWTVASNAYERYLPHLLKKGNWKFTTLMGELTRLGASTFPGFTDIYSKPADCVHLIAVWDTATAADIREIPLGVIPRLGTLPPALAYRVIGNTVHCAAPAGVTGMYVGTPAEGDWPPDFVEALTLNIESVLQRGLNEDMEASQLAKKLAMVEVNDARSRGDQEEPKRVAFRSAMREARRTHRRG